MPKIAKIYSDTFLKNLVQAARQKYLEREGKSLLWQEVKKMELKKARNRNAKVDQEIGLHLPLLNSQQKNVVLSMVRVMGSKQVRLWDQLHIEQKPVLKKNKATREKNVTSTKVPGVNMAQVLASPPRMVKENAAKPKK